MPPNTLPTDHAPGATRPIPFGIFFRTVSSPSSLPSWCWSSNCQRKPGPTAFITEVAPTLAVYLLSFTYTGIYWINHNHLLHRLKRVDAPILYANLLLLFCLSLLPFATSLRFE